MGTDKVMFHLLPESVPEVCNRKIRANLQARLRLIPGIKYSTKEEIQKMQMAEAGRKLIKFIDMTN